MPELSLDRAKVLAHDFYTEAGPVSAVSEGYSRDEILASLRQNLDGIRAEVEGMSAEQLAYRLPGAPSGPDESGNEEHFDTAQIMTHMASAIGFHWWNMTRAMRHERPPMPKPPEGTALTGKKSKSIMGGGGWTGLSAAELCALLDKTANGFVDYVNQLPGDTGDARSSFSPFSNMSPHDWLFVVAVHAGTHLLQIREMKAEEDFPQN